MPVVFTAVLPSYVTLEMVHQVHDEIGGARPDGLIVHAVTYDEVSSSFRVIDIWESEKARDEFAQTYLAPAIRRVTAEAGERTPAPVSMEAAETLLLMTGR